MNANVSRVVILTGDTDDAWLRYDGPIASDTDADA